MRYKITPVYVYVTDTGALEFHLVASAMFKYLNTMAEIVLGISERKNAQREEGR